jgi:peroxiredoxin
VRIEKIYHRRPYLDLQSSAKRPSFDSPTRRSTLTDDVHQQTEFPLPAGLPRPADDGAADHLAGMHVPKIGLRSTSGRVVALAELNAVRTVIYGYPMTGVPGKPLPEGWDAIPGARGCTPQACNFRDHYQELSQLGTEVFGLSTQTTEYQREMADRLHLPFEVLSDAAFELCDALRLPTFETAGMRLLKRLTLIIRDGRIEHSFYPVFPSNESADQVLHWLREHPVAK